MPYSIPEQDKGPFVSRKHKHHGFGTIVGDLRTRIDRAANEGRFQHALELARQLHKSDPNPANRELLHRVGLGRARQLRQEGRTRDAAATLHGLLDTPGVQPAWHAELAGELAACGEVQQAQSLLGEKADPHALDNFLAQAADAAVEREQRGRDLLPDTLRPDFQHILTAFLQLQAGDDEAMRVSLQPIGLRSPFLEWKLFLRGLQAYYQNDDPRALENWQRLEPERLPAHLAAPLRFSIDKDYQAAQPPKTQAILRKQADTLQSSESLRLLNDLRSATAGPKHYPSILRKAEAAKKVLEAEAPHLVPRLATYFYWATMTQGEPEDVPRYQRTFGAPAHDPHFHRLHALAWERAHVLDEAHKHWQQYEKEIEANPTAWPGETGTRARALIWQRMGRNAASIPEGEMLKRLPPFLRNHPDRPKPLKPTTEECFRKSIALAPELAETHLNLFHHLAFTNKPARAIKAGQALLALQPNHLEMLTELAAYLQEQQQYAEAIEVYEQALKNNPLDRSLRSRLSTSHLFNARTLAEAGRYDEARRGYQTCLDLEASEKSSVLCKWAACEIKAGDATRGEELLQRALAASSSGLAVNFSMVIEAIRLKLPPAVKKRFEKGFADGLTLPPDPETAMHLASTAGSHRAAGIEYRGQKGHEKKVLDYLKKAQSTPFTENQLESVCESLVEIGSYRLAKSYTEMAGRRFNQNPVFKVLEAENELDRGEGLYQPWRVRYLLTEARRLAESLPPGPRRDHLLERIQSHMESIEEMNPFARMFDDGMGPFGGFDPFNGPDEYEDEDDEDGWM